MDSAIPVAEYQRSEKWIARLTLVFGLAVALLVGAMKSVPWGAGIFVGAVLAWFNFRWLRRGMDALTAASAAQEGQPKPQVPVSTYFTAAFRYLLIALAVYVIFEYLNVPVLSMVLGLCALGAATIAVSVHEILSPPE
jgi:small-conductance mechanosensitive channel